MIVPHPIEDFFLTLGRKVFLLGGFPFQGLEHKFQALEHIFQDLEHKFQGLEQEIVLGRKTFSSRGKSFST